MKHEISSLPACDQSTHTKNSIYALVCRKKRLVHHSFCMDNDKLAPIIRYVGRATLIRFV